VNDYVEVPDSNSLDIVNTVTVGMWLKIPSSVTTTMAILIKTIDYPNYGVDVINGKLRFFGYQGTTAKGIISAGGTAINDNVWHYVVEIFDGQNWLIYVDGKQNQSKTDPATLTVNTQQLRIGIRGVIYPFNGLIDEVRIYNRALSDAEIQALYNATK
jgi:large repetitive protein